MCIASNVFVLSLLAVDYNCIWNGILLAHNSHTFHFDFSIFNIYISAHETGRRATFNMSINMISLLSL